MLRPQPLRRLTIVASLVTAALPLLPGCASHEQVVVKERVVLERPASMRPVPAPIREDRGNPPGADWGWVPGHWKWEGHDWAWVHGRWVQQVVPPMPAVIVEQIAVAPSPHHVWIPGHWVWRFDRGAWLWVNGHWQG